MAGSGSAARSKARSGKEQKAPSSSAGAANRADEDSRSKKQSALHETTGIRGLYDRCSKFLYSVNDEIHRISWPSGKDLRAATIVVMVTLIMVSVYMGLVNSVFALVFGTPESTGL